jgi:sortase (surface protein transpeptidase)
MEFSFPKITPKRVLAGGVIVAVVAVSAAVVAPAVAHKASQMRQKSERASTSVVPRPPNAASQIPSRLRIAAIGVDSRIESVGITASGTMGVPHDVHDVGWYAIGVRPGQPGDAVIDGHLTWSTGPAVFSKLSQLKAGDMVVVDYADGTTHEFKVQKSQSFAWNDRPPQLFAAGGAPRLSLVTCSGTWDGKAYSPRVVVDAAMVS